MDFPTALIAVVVLSLGYAIYTEIVLRGAALSARGRILTEYEEKLFIMERNPNTQVSDGVGDAAPTTGSTNPANGSKPNLYDQQ